MRKRNLLLRTGGLVAAAGALTLISAGTAFAFNSPGNPGSTGDNTITWTGQGAPGGALGTTDCSAAGDPNGANQPYLLWILTVDGGSIQNDATTPVLNLGGSGSGAYTTTNPSDNSAAHFVTPYFKPDSSLTASAVMKVLTTGNGEWNLVISHGCAGTTNPPAAQPLTASKTAAGSYDTKWTWGIAKAVDKTKVEQVGGQATFNYTVSVTHDSGSNSNVKVKGNIDVNNPNTANVTISGIVDALSDGTSCTVDTSGVASYPSLPSGDSIFPYTCSMDASSFDPANLPSNGADVTWNQQTL